MRVSDRVTKLVPRSNRIVPVDKDWYFKTREGDFLGPYRTMEDAEFGIDVYVALSKLDVEHVA